MNVRRAAPLCVVGLVSTLAATACGSTPAQKIAVSERDYSIALDSASVANGKLDLDQTNAGPSSHEVLVFRTDLAADALPLGADGRVDEDHGAGITKVFDSGSDTAAGKQRTLHTSLPPGRYVVICNINNHYTLGMHASLTVT